MPGKWGATAERARFLRPTPLLIAYGVLGLLVLLQPHPTIAAGVVSRLDETLQWLGAPSWATASGRVEALTNAALFVPPAALALLALPRLPWTAIVTAGFIGSLGVEILQGLFLPARSAQAIDIVANTAGATAGAVLVLAWRWVRSRHDSTASRG